MDKVIKIKDLEDSNYDMYFLVSEKDFERAINMVELAYEIVDREEGNISMYEEITGLWSCENVKYIELNLEKPDYEIVC